MAKDIPLQQSVQSFILYPLPMEFQIILDFDFEFFPLHLETTCFSFNHRWVAKKHSFLKRQALAIRQPSCVECDRAIVTFLSKYS